MKEPISTITNITFVIAGIYWMNTSILVGACLVFLGIASGGYHWTKDRIWQSADVAGMYLVLFSIIAHYTYYPLALLALPFILFERRLPTFTTIPILAGILFVIVAVQATLITTISALVVAGVGLYFWKRSETNTRAYHDLWHSGWHVAMGIVFALLA